MKPDVLALEAEYEKSLALAAELKVQLDRARGIASGKVVPHDSVIEDAAHAAGMALRRELQERHMRELSATHVGTARCPKCGERCAVDGVQRKVTSGDGPVQLTSLFTAAKAVHPESSADAWDQYQVWMTGCCRREVGQVIAELQSWQERLGEPPKESPATDPRVVAKTTLRSLTNIQSRMKYAEYRPPRHARDDLLDGGGVLDSWLSEADGGVRVLIEALREGLRCRSCGSSRVQVHDGAVRTWLSAPIGLTPVEVIMNSPRVKCLSCEAKT